MPLDPVARAALLLERPELLEASLARIYHHFKNTPMGINITAFKSELDKETNASNMDKLESWLRARRFGFIRSRGPWVDKQGKVWPAEPGFTVPRMSFTVALWLARAKDWRQAAFFWTDGKGQGNMYDTDTGNPTDKIPWQHFHVFAKPEDLPKDSGGTVPSRGKEHTRGFSIRASFKEALGSLELRRNLKLPMDGLYLVEFDLPGRLAAMCGVGGVNIGLFVDETFLCLEADGTVNGVNTMVPHILRMAPLMELKE